MSDDYAIDAQGYFDRYESIVPERIYELCRVFFKKGKATVDIGSGSGRDVGWLNEQGFPAVGIDWSKKMIKLATIKRPNCRFHIDSLPNLKTLKNSQYDNLLCSGVFMWSAGGWLDTFGQRIRIG